MRDVLTQAFGELSVLHVFISIRDDDEFLDRRPGGSRGYGSAGAGANARAGVDFSSSFSFGPFSVFTDAFSSPLAVGLPSLATRTPSITHHI